MKGIFRKTVWSMLAVGAVMLSSCSDDEEYAADVYFTGSQPTIMVIGPGATAEPASGMAAAFNFTFTAASDWTITAKNYNSSETATWVKFYQNSGTEGGQRLGLYADANTTGKDRAATVEVTSNGSTASFLLIQQGGTAVNPNEAAIDPAKVVDAVEFYQDGKVVKSYTFGYTAGVVSAIAVTNGEGATPVTYTIESDGRLADNAVVANKVDVTNGVESRSFALIDGKLEIGYLCSVMEYSMLGKQINFGFTGANQLSSVSADGYKATLNWASANNNAAEFAFPGNSGSYSVTYGSELNDTNIDLNAFVALAGVGYGVDTECHALSALNLAGVRSANLATKVTINGTTTDITYTDGINYNGKTGKGLTAVLAANGLYQTVLVKYAE